LELLTAHRADANFLVAGWYRPPAPRGYPHTTKPYFVLESNGTLRNQAPKP